MIFAINTPNHAGISILGDNMDFEELYETLHAIVGEEGEFLSHDSARLRVLGVCYDIRHALMGDREIQFMDNGMDAEKKKWLGVITPDKNIYLKFNVLWPEILFVIMALNDFVRLYAGKNAKKAYHAMTDKRNIWDPSITHVRAFQSAVMKCIKETVSSPSYTRMLNMMHKDYTWFDNYVTQYVDILNCRLIDMDKEKRIKNIPTMAKRLAEHGDEYKQVQIEVLAAAKAYGCPVSSLRANVDYPEEIEW
ncbi:DUF6904 family protein [Ammoniphilus resinae]|uniref:Uncharacterized protein n=1 Tax=Ammoniphilus resinae TaxID=861532 RepID=A0ABS4GSL6_9BACL|nr:hypothetical protein [Ammoniphilus resinae]MBP1933231.1 hypothetical protein [Ammoniphilus resinae]